MHKPNLGELSSRLALLSCKDNIDCFLLYGSIFRKEDGVNLNDTDIIIVLRDIKRDTRDLFDFIFSEFPNPDFHTYTSEEIEKGVSFFSREYVLEYLSKGICLLGSNIFLNKFISVSDHQYRRSILIRSIEHVQMVRKIYYSPKHSAVYKLFFVKKYIIRLSRNILLFRKLIRYDQLDLLSDAEVIELIKKYGILLTKYSFLENSKEDLEYYFQIFCAIGANLIACRNDISE